MQRHLRVGKAARDDVCGVCGGAGAAQAASVLPRLGRPATGRRLRIQSEMAKDLLDHGPLEDGGDDLEFPGAAPRAVPHVDVEDPLEQPRPADAAGPGLNRLDFALGANRCFGGRLLLSRRPLRHHPPPQLRMGRQHPVVPDQVQPRSGYQRRQAGARVGPRNSGGELVHRLARLATRRRLRIQPQVREDLLDRRDDSGVRGHVDRPGSLLRDRQAASLSQSRGSRIRSTGAGRRSAAS